MIALKQTKIQIIIRALNIGRPTVAATVAAPPTVAALPTAAATAIAAEWRLLLVASFVDAGGWLVVPPVAAGWLVVAPVAACVRLGELSFCRSSLWGGSSAVLECRFFAAQSFLPTIL